jgi:DNA-binding MarR family transcriptional regulator
MLSAVELQPGLSNAALARAAFVTPQTMQGVLANVGRGGLVVRTADPAHGRILRTEPTVLGRTVLADAHRVAQGLEAVMITAVGRAEAERLARSLTRCADDLAGGA